MPTLAVILALAGCGTDRRRDPADNLADWRAAARFYCLGDDAQPAPGASTSGGDLAACQGLVRDAYR